MRICGRTFFVTGGGSGLGAATVRALEESGGKILVAGRRHVPTHGNTIFVRVDVTCEEEMRAAVRTAVEEFGELHGAINCAGVAFAEKVLGKDGPHSLHSFLEVVRVNLVGTFNAVRLAAAAMQYNKPTESGERGVIVNTASIAAFDGQVGQAAYSASKAGVCGMTLPLARELAHNGIRVMTIAPGIFDTPALVDFPEEIRADLLDQVPFPRRFGHPSEFAALVQHIVENEMLNGEVVRLDGATRLPLVRRASGAESG